MRLLVEQSSQIAFELDFEFEFAPKITRPFIEKKSQLQFGARDESQLSV